MPPARRGQRGCCDSETSKPPQKFTQRTGTNTWPDLTFYITCSFGALTLRTHGSCGYLPHLRELFAAPDRCQQRWPRSVAAVWAIRNRLFLAGWSLVLPVPAFDAARLTTGTTPIFASLYRSYSTDTDGAPDTTHTCCYGLLREARRLVDVLHVTRGSWLR